MAWRFAIWPTRRSPVFAKATTDGVSRLPSALGMTCGSPPMTTAITELVVPRSMPTTFAIVECSSQCLARGRRAGEPGGRGLLARHLDLHRLRLGSLALRDPDLKDAVLVGRRGLVALDPRRQRDGADEGPVAQLPPVVVPLLLFLLGPGLTLNGQGVLGHADLDMLGVDPRQFGADHDVAVCLVGLDGGLPDHRRAPPPPAAPRQKPLAHVH